MLVRVRPRAPLPAALAARFASEPGDGWLRAEAADEAEAAELVAASQHAVGPRRRRATTPDAGRSVLDPRAGTLGVSRMVRLEPATGPRHRAAPVAHPSALIAAPVRGVLLAGPRSRALGAGDALPADPGRRVVLPQPAPRRDDPLDAAPPRPGRPRHRLPRRKLVPEPAEPVLVAPPPSRILPGLGARRLDQDHRSSRRPSRRWRSCSTATASGRSGRR